MSDRVITTGVSGNANRLEINDFVKNDKFFSLYIQALQQMSDVNQDQVKSFFQIGGIHGLPFTPWDNVTGDQPPQPNMQWEGYCTHGSYLFPTWHRPYVALCEQLLQQHAQSIANTYTTSDKQDWVDAAANLRQPYWDWAANSVPPDQIIAQKQVTITAPNGQQQSVDNPWFSYVFHPIDPSFPPPFEDWPTTVRRPKDGVTDVERLKAVLRGSQNDITTSTYSMLTRIHEWAAFSNHTPGDGGSTSNSLEAIHDGIHVDVGGAGHMGDPAVAGFDPIFFLHHANVDRLLSLWAALNPGVWVIAGDSEDGTFTIPPDAPIDATTSLTPFSESEQSFWTSAGATETTKLGYNYPEFDGLDLGNEDEVKSAIGEIVNRLYGSSIFGFFGGAGASQPSKGTEKPSAAAPPPKAPSGRGAAEPQAPVSHAEPSGGRGERALYDWTARITFKKYEFGKSFSVLLFIGSVPEDPAEWRTSPHFVGAHHAFVNSAAAHCANCRNQTNIKVEGFVHLTQYIARHAKLSSLQPDVVEPYLTKELHWRVQKADGSVAQLESLEVAVFGTPLSLPPGSMFPVPGQRRHFHGITRGRSGLLSV